MTNQDIISPENLVYSKPKLMNDSPMLVADAIVSARWTRHIVVENIILSFAIKIGFLALGAAGLATLWEAVFADVGVALLATVNSLRARR